MKGINNTLCVLTALIFILSGCAGKDDSIEKATTVDTVQAPINGDNEAMSSSETETELPPETTEDMTTDNITDEYSDFVPVVRVVFASDTHLSTSANTESERLGKLFESAYRYADADESYNKLDAVLIAGDMTNAGSPEEYAFFKRTVKSHIRDDTQLVTVMGNHEHGHGHEGYLASMDDSLNKDIVINGFHFIGISPSDYNYYPKDTRKWLEETLAAASAENPEKPIFTFQHHHVKDTVYVSAEWYTPDSTYLRKIYGKYPQVVNFSGDSHGPVNNPTSIWQGEYTALGTGTISYFEMTSGMTYGTLPPRKELAAQYYIVEADANNRVRIQPYNILTDSFFKTPSNCDDENEQLIWYIDKPSDTTTFRYKTDDRRSVAEAPYFAEGAELELNEITESSVELTIPQAYDKQCVYSYEIRFETEKEALTFNYFSEYYIEPMPDKLTYEINGLLPDSAYKVSVYPHNCYDMRGEPVTLEFSTPKAEIIVYNSENPVKYSGTFTDFDSMEQLRAAKNSFAYGGEIDGDVFIGEWNGAGANSDSHTALADGKGFEGSKALEVWSDGTENQGLYIFATPENRNPVKYPSPRYLRVWVDFTDVSFRKANFGLLTKHGVLFTTDEGDGRNDQLFWYLPEGETEWKQFRHGNDGCFGDAQSSSVKGFKGWMAFPLKDFLYRDGTGKKQGNTGASFVYSETSGVYFFWDYSDDGSYSGKKFYLDEIHLVSDYKVFEEYDG